MMLLFIGRVPAWPDGSAPDAFDGILGQGVDPAGGKMGWSYIIN